MRRLFLIDANALCYRSFHAIKGLATSQGQPTNAVYGFTSTLRKIIREFQPPYLAACFDVGAKTHRQEKFAEYKIQRPAMPADLISQMPIIKKVLSAYRLPVVEQEGYEADDLIATIVEKMRGQTDIEVVIVSEDKDMFQLVGDNVKIYSVKSNKFLGPADIKDMTGVEPQFVPDLIGLAGDSSDNIPGVKGVGDVTAKTLIGKYGSLENILKNSQDIQPPGLREKLTEQRDRAVLSKELAVLHKDLKIDLDLDRMSVREPDPRALMALFYELEFNKFAEELSKNAEGNNITVKDVKTDLDKEKLLESVRQAGRFAFLWDSSQASEETFFSQDMFLTADGQEIFRIPADLQPGFEPVFSNPKILKITFDFKQELKNLDKFFAKTPGEIFDAFLAGYLLSPSGTNDLRTLAWQYLKMPLPDEQGRSYAVKTVFDLYEPLQKELKEKDLVRLYEEIEIPLSVVLYRMEKQGVAIDQGLLNQLSRETHEKLQGLVNQIYKDAGQEFNINSPKQLSEVLFQKLRLPVLKRTKTGFSTDEGVLAKLAQEHPLPAKLLEYRQLAKLKSTYFDALPKLIDPKTGRVHASFNQAGTETGRLSSNNPNLQNIPIRTELGRQIRKAFIAGKDHWIISADYSQIELRILAHLSEDQNLVRAFLDDADIHQVTAAQVFDVPEQEVTSEMRHSAKRVNFGIIYGMSAFGLAKDLEISQAQAQDFIDKYFLKYPGVKAFMDRSILECEEKGYVVTLLGRRRYLPDIHSPNIMMRQLAQRQAINTPVQGSAADLIKLSMIRIQEHIDKSKLSTRMIITVHDELVFDVPEEEVQAFQPVIRQCMEHPLRLKVPIKVSMKKGRNWLEME